jgi:hypothetical protein
MKCGPDVEHRDESRAFVAEMAGYRVEERILDAAPFLFEHFSAVLSAFTLHFRVILIGKDFL